ncbi:FAD-binding domain-containing protein [Ampelomyces quisqualis]|uniref:ferric-chelate reductase (NADPH) n=1 Tax=Ampelomyces quisqualis TaxID=50730 RepID=A0A6A5QNT5_AMPQU|nr:FAD-binding domain-containing protein [Ampelomyces quisqualis]
MSHNHMSMGSATLPPLYDFPKIYWTVVGSAIGVAMLVNIYNNILCRQRLSAAKAGIQHPAKPRSWLALCTATVFAVTREASHYSFHIALRTHVFRLPSVGRVSLVLANAITLVVLCLYGLDLTGRFTKEDVAFRCGVVTLGQLPLIFLLAGKNNIIGYLSGVSYERLNWLHRWCARTMLLTATIHMGYFFSSWDRYDYIPYKLKNDQISWKGLVAWSVLVWIVFSSMTPIRGWCYELFVIQHLMSFAVFTGFVYIHIPSDTKAYVWVPVAFFFLDRTIRASVALYANVSLFHPKQRQQGHMNSFFACKAEFTPLSHNTTRVLIRKPPISWTPGQHVFLSCHSIVPLQSHPFTVASIPEDGVMEFLIKSESGGTRHFFRHAERTIGMPDATMRSKTVTIEGPYGCLRPVRQFDSVVLFAGSTGATFTLPLLRDIVQGWRENTGVDAEKKKIPLLGRTPGAVTRHVRYVWVVKSRGQLGWFSEQLFSIAAEVQSLQERLRDVKLHLTVYVTCDEAFTEEHKSLLSAVAATAPNTKTQKKVGHGTVQYRNPSSRESDSKTTEQENIREVTDVMSKSQNKALTTTCCCRTKVDEHAEPDSIALTCYCPTSQQKTTHAQQSSPPPSTTSSPPSTPLPASHAKPFLHPSIALYTGRPNIKAIIRTSLEQARGESAVVACGPHGLAAEIKRQVCSLSDERAVHKGTGAQGVYLHTESFSC